MDWFWRIFTMVTAILVSLGLATVSIVFLTQGDFFMGGVGLSVTYMVVQYWLGDNGDGDDDDLTLPPHTLP